MRMTSTSIYSPGRLPCGLPFVEVVSLWILMSISTSEGRLQEKYIGCFYDESQATVPAIVSFPKDDALTIDKCIAKCQTLNTTYAALQNGNICYCRNNYGVQLGLSDSACNWNCSGNKNQVCGGFLGQQMTYSSYAVCPIGTYGAACDKGCHCKRDIPCDRMTGNCPDGCYGNWSGQACNITTVSHQYIGCFRDDATRTLEICIYCENKGYNNKNNTIQSCIKSCEEKSYSYAGVQYSYACFCGDRYDRHGTSTTVTCNMSCTGDSKTICGGIWANSVYSVCPIGNYGKSCAGRCHCYNGRRCINRNGTCPSSQCEPGWTGTSCNMRDCTRNNGDCFTSEKCSAINLTYSTVSVCSCTNGFQRTSLRGNCTDTDECSLNVCDPDSMICTNTIGSYDCSCRSGFQAHNATTCIDIDECSLKMCDADTTLCTNTIGSYDCSCRRGFEALNDTVTACMDIDECHAKPCEFYSMTDCQNTPGSYTCICQQWFWSFNGYNCTGERAITAGAIGFIAGAVLSLAIAFAFIQICRRRKYRDGAMSENKSNISMSISPEVEPNGDEAVRYVSRPCKPKIEDCSRTKPTAKGTASGKGKSGSGAKVRGKICRSTKDEAAFNAASDINTYESFSAGASGFDETTL